MIFFSVFFSEQVQLISAPILEVSPGGDLRRLLIDRCTRRILDGEDEPGPGHHLCCGVEDAIGRIAISGAGSADRAAVHPGGAVKRPLPLHRNLAARCQPAHAQPQHQLGEVEAETPILLGGEDGCLGCPVRIAAEQNVFTEVDVHGWLHRTLSP